jgi:nitrile hydratase beta subunit
VRGRDLTPSATVRPHDLGGRSGFGAVPIEDGEPVFHAPWEAAVVAGTIATMMRGVYNVDQWRAGIDGLELGRYRGAGYYGRWLHSLEVSCVEAGVVTREELDERIADLVHERVSDRGEGAQNAAQTREHARLLADLHKLVEHGGASNQRAVSDAPRFAVRDRVRARVLRNERHARIPGYVQGHIGVVERANGAYVFCDSHRLGKGEDPQYVYTVRFCADELWPEERDNCWVLVDLWESYLTPADTTGESW